MVLQVSALLTEKKISPRNDSRPGYPERASKGIASSQCACCDDVIGDSCMGWSQGSRLSASQEAASCQQIPFTETHLLRMSIFPLNPSKGFPESSSMSTGPRVFEVMILCVFMALKSLSYGRVVSCV
ncbi:hypothetical protein JOQ06_026664 [Pogonophryne albipinna]|uniref:Uncharacterized protein n=1 Tax=Pogonophryne albipinna TaxID=1090488 RepID=A0AAD6BDW7_9TELE|nr:hypothetical protein JOQ06_026664 [Pogonophryne albipinna]